MADLYLYEDIESGSAGKFVADLNKTAGEDVTLHVSSYGGDVFDGMVMMNALRSHPGQVTAVVEGVAASIASVIVAGGANRVVMRPGARMMIHNALTVAVGNADELSSTSDRLRDMSSELAKVYAERAGTDVAEWQAAMDAETWFTADEAVAAGLADAVEDGRLERAEPVLAATGSRMMNKFRGRRGDPPAALLKSRLQGGERGDDMSLSKEDIVAIIRDELQTFRNEAVQISGEVDVTYPDDVKIIPTERIKVSPNVGDNPAETVEGEPAPVEEAVDDSAAVQLAKHAGLTFVMGDVADGFTAEVDESGVVTITAPSGAEVGSTAAFSVLVNDTPVPLSVTVRSLADGEDTQEGNEPPAAPSGESNSNPADSVTLPMEVYNDMRTAAQMGWSLKNDADRKSRESEVDTWIREGRANASYREKIVNQMHTNPEATRALYSAVPKGSVVPVSELGHSGSDDTVRDISDKAFNARAVAAARRKEGK